MEQQQHSRSLSHQRWGDTLHQLQGVLDLFGSAAEKPFGSLNMHWVTGPFPGKIRAYLVLLTSGTVVSCIQVDGDLSATIPLLAETGPLSLPLRCLARRAVPSVEPCPLVCLDGRAGGIMLAATGHKTATISNAGALAVMYDIKV